MYQLEWKTESFNTFGCPLDQNPFHSTPQRVLQDLLEDTHDFSERNGRNMEANISVAKATEPTPVQKKKADPSNGLSFIDSVRMDLVELDIKCDDETQTYVGVSGRQLSIETVATDIEANRDSQNKPRIPRERIVHALERLLEKGQDKLFVETLAVIAHDPNTKDSFPELAEVIGGTQRTDEEKKFVAPLLRYVVWCMKRRLIGHRVDNPILLNVYGRANCGKSRFLELLLSPLPRALWFACPHGDTLMNDERWARTFGDYFGIVLDELGGMRKADLAKLKNSIDSPFLTYRVMRTNSVSRVHNNAQLLGTSNHRLRDTFAADDNVRKYAEIDFVNFPTLHEQESMVWEPLNKFNWVGLWRSVDEKSDRSPLSDDWEAFLIWTSNKCVKQTAANIWWSRFLDEHEGQTISASVIRLSLENYYQNHGIETQYRKSKNALANMLESAGCQRDRSSGKGTFYKLPLKAESRLYFPDADSEVATAPECEDAKMIVNDETW